MKKTISLLMAVVMLLSVTMGINFSAFASEKEVVSATLKPVKQYTIFQGNYGGYDEDGNGYYWMPEPNYGDVITLKFSDGTSEQYTYKYQEYAGFFNSENDELNFSRYSVDFDDAGNAFGGYCLFDYDVDIYVEVRIKENPIKSFFVIPVKPYEMIEHTYSYIEEQDWYQLDYNLGDKIKVNYTNGSVDTFTYNGEWDGAHDSSYVFVNNKNEKLYVEGTSAFEFKGTGSTSVEVKLSDYGNRVEVPVNIIENPVKDVIVTPVKTYEIVEKTYGYDYGEENDYEDEKGIWCYYAPSFEKGDKITVKLKDGTVNEYIYKSSVEGDEPSFFDANNNELVIESQNFKYKGIGETSFKIELRDYYYAKDVPVTIIENPVDSISFVPKKAYEVLENTHGYEVDESFYYYAPHFNEGDKIIVKYTNGTSKEFSYKYDENESSYYFSDNDNNKLDVEGYEFAYSGLGSTTFEVEVSNYAKSVDVPVTIIANPVDSISFVPAKEFEVVENTGGYYTGDDEEYCYEAPKFNAGDKVIVKYNNGTSNEFYKSDDAEDYNFYDSNDNALYVSSDCFYYSGTGLTTFKVTAVDYNKSADVPVKVVKNSTPTPTPGGGSTGGGGGAPAPAPTTPEVPEEKPTEPATKPAETPSATSLAKPAQVAVNKPQAKEEAVVVTWKKAKNVSGYEVQLATDKKFKKNKKKVNVKKQNASKKTVKKLKKNKKYYVRVRSYKIVNGKKVYGKWSKIKSVKTK